jgi:hypothetical protein
MFYANAGKKLTFNLLTFVNTFAFSFLCSTPVNSYRTCKLKVAGSSLVETSKRGFKGKSAFSSAFSSLSRTCSEPHPSLIIRGKITKALFLHESQSEQTKSSSNTGVIYSKIRTMTPVSTTKCLTKIPLSLA